VSLKNLVTQALKLLESTTIKETTDIFQALKLPVITYNMENLDSIFPHVFENIERLWFERILWLDGAEKIIIGKLDVSGIQRFLSEVLVSKAMSTMKIRSELLEFLESLFLYSLAESINLIFGKGTAKVMAVGAGKGDIFIKVSDEDISLKAEITNLIAENLILSINSRLYSFFGVRCPIFIFALSKTPIDLSSKLSSNEEKLLDSFKILESKKNVKWNLVGFEKTYSEFNNSTSNSTICEYTYETISCCKRCKKFFSINELPENKDKELCIGCNLIDSFKKASQNIDPTLARTSTIMIEFNNNSLTIKPFDNQSENRLLQKVTEFILGSGITIQLPENLSIHSTFSRTTRFAICWVTSRNIESLDSLNKTNLDNIHWMMYNDGSIYAKIPNTKKYHYVSLQDLVNTTLKSLNKKNSYIAFAKSDIDSFGKIFAFSLKNAFKSQINSSTREYFKIAFSLSYYIEYFVKILTSQVIEDPSVFLDHLIKITSSSEEFTNLIKQLKDIFNVIQEFPNNEYSLHVHILYAGGDDITLVGRFLDVILAVMLIWLLFKLYTHNTLGFSTGVSIDKATFPFYLLNKRSSKLEETAKNIIKYLAKQHALSINTSSKPILKDAIAIDTVSLFEKGSICLFKQDILSQLPITFSRFIELESGFIKRIAKIQKLINYPEKDISLLELFKEYMRLEYYIIRKEKADSALVETYSKIKNTFTISKDEFLSYSNYKRWASIFLACKLAYETKKIINKTAEENSSEVQEG